MNLTSENLTEALNHLDRVSAHIRGGAHDDQLTQLEVQLVKLERSIRQVNNAIASRRVTQRLREVGQ